MILLININSWLNVNKLRKKRTAEQILLKQFLVIHLYLYEIWNSNFVHISEKNFHTCFTYNNIMMFLCKDVLSWSPAVFLYMVRWVGHEFRIFPALFEPNQQKCRQKKLLTVVPIKCMSQCVNDASSKKIDFCNFFLWRCPSCHYRQIFLRTV